VTGSDPGYAAHCRQQGALANFKSTSRRRAGESTLQKKWRKAHHRKNETIEAMDEE